MELQLALVRVRHVALENELVHTLQKMGRTVRQRWLAFCFARKFYRQARTAEAIPQAGGSAMIAEDLMERMNRRALTARMHALVQLRVAAQLASIVDTEARARMCRAQGWSEEQVGAVLLGNFNGSFTDQEKLVLRYAEDISRTPIDIDPQVVRQLRAHFGPAELAELAAAVAQENFRIRFASAHNRVGA